MPTLTVRMFGRLVVEEDGRELGGIEPRKVQELFSYLLLYRDQANPREALASLLWGDSTTSQSKKYLRQTLWQLQSALGPQADSRNGCVLLVESEWVQLNPEADLWLDVAVFERASELARGVPGQRLDPSVAQIMQEAARLYRGDLLEGWYQDWCLYERERLQNIYLAILSKLMIYCEAHGKYEDGLYCGECALQCDAAQERVHRRLMRLHYLAGDRTAALRQFEHCAAVLDEELGVRPSDRTIALHEQIRADRLDDPNLVPYTTSAASQAETDSLIGILTRLEKLQQVLDDVQRQVRQEIDAVERILDDRP
jgi:DNA-binding SARP family transcriptional activator